MNRKDYLTTGTQTVAALFAAFNGFLKNILPEQIEIKTFLYGFLQISCLIIFLLLKFLILNRKKSNLWINIVIISFISVLISGFGYYYHSVNTLQKVGESNYMAISGTLSDSSKTFCNSNNYKNDKLLHTKSCEEGILFYATTADIPWIWTTASVQKNVAIFIIVYSVFVFSITVCIFALLELIPLKT